uniref:DNA-directed RNA polymerase insert domain-containing protein n=1 Tax=Aegilops tauschii subsp. strangulata TaxID=200361 RepID=A0A453H6Q3_AEGTS
MVKGAGSGRDAALRAIAKSSQADTVGIALRRALLGEIEGTCITRAKFGSVPHEYSTIAGIEESVQEILLNLKEIVLRSNLSMELEAHPFASKVLDT